MEIEYSKKKIRDELLNKEFDEWNKDSIITLISIFQYSQCKELYTISLMLLDDYIKWYNNTKELLDQYPVKKLIDLQKLIKDDLYHNEHYNYESYLNEEVNIKNEYKEEYSCYNDYGLYSLFIGIFLVMYLIFSNLSYCFVNKRVEIVRNDHELKLPLPEDLMSNPLIKLLLQKVF